MRINVGCGMTPTKGWINFDNSLSILLAKLPAIVVRVLFKIRVISDPSFRYIQFCKCNDIRFANVSRRIPLDDAVVDVIYSSHMLEHMDRESAARFLGEARRVLNVGGIIRIAVPDLSIIMSDYRMSNNADKFMESMHVCDEVSQTFLQRCKTAFMGIRHHQWMYDGVSLVNLLTRSGFEHASVMKPGYTCISEYGDLNLRERENESVYVEARRANVALSIAVEGKYESVVIQ